MKIEEAIKYLGADKSGVVFNQQARQLGIEALGVIDAIRNLDGYMTPQWSQAVSDLTDLLPSEGEANES